MEKRWFGKECRWGDRLRVDIPIQVSTNTAADAEGCMKNLSLSGALVRTEVEFGIHALVRITLKMPPPSKRAATIAAYVSRKAQEGVGVEWCEFAPPIVKDLLRSPTMPFPWQRPGLF